MRKRIISFLAVLTTLFAVFITAGGDASAKSIIWGNGTGVDYKGCHFHVEYDEYGLGRTRGWAANLIIKHDDGRGPSGCSAETVMNFKYIRHSDKKVITTKQDFYFPTLPRAAGGPAGPGVANDGVLLNVPNTIVILCRSNFDDCKTFYGKKFT